MSGKIFESNEFHMNLSSCQKTIACLPEEIIFNILILLPAHILHGVVRYVCRAWYTIIQYPRFVTAHFTLAPHTFLLHTQDIPPGVDFSYCNVFDVTKGHLKLTDFKFQIRRDMRFLSTCNGLILTIFCGIYYVGNPITRRILRLPLRPSYTGCALDSLTTLAFQASSNVYKVVVPFNDNKSQLDGFAILTVGVDKAWRYLKFTELEIPRSIFKRGQISVPGFIYFETNSKTCIYGWDLESETIKSIAIPHVCHYSEKYIRRKGDSISLWYHNPDFTMEVWVLKDYKTEEWVKFLYIEGEPIINMSKNIWSRNGEESIIYYHILFAAESWLGNDEKILFRIDHFAVFDYISGMTKTPYDGSGHYILYDPNTRTCTVVMEAKNFCRYVPFISTLVWV